MPVGKKLAIVVAIVVVGIGLALLFRKNASALRFWESASDDPFAKPVERRVLADAAWAGRGPAARRDAHQQQSRRAASAATAAIGQGGNVRDTAAANPVGSLLPPIEGIVGEQYDGPLEGDWPSSGASAGDVRRHTVADGDTLSILAARYLGRADAYRELFEFNRDVLDSPDLLPIGAVLKIPPRQGSSSAANFEVSAPLEMVPVPSRGG